MVPSLRPGIPVVYHVPRTAADHDGAREDVSLPGVEGLFSDWFWEARALAHLVDYIAAWFQQGSRDESAARLLGRLLIGELVRSAQTPTTSRSCSRRCRG